MQCIRVTVLGSPHPTHRPKTAKKKTLDTAHGTPLSHRLEQQQENSENSTGNSGNSTRNSGNSTGNSNTVGHRLGQQQETLVKPIKLI
jgi:hypothetical protein